MLRRSYCIARSTLLKTLKGDIARLRTLSADASSRYEMVAFMTSSARIRQKSG